MGETLDYKGNKGFRLLSIHERLGRGEWISKAKLAKEYNVTGKTIQRDIDDLRAYLAENTLSVHAGDIKYDKSKNAYYLVQSAQSVLTSQEVLAVGKILLESRAFCKTELDKLLAKLLVLLTAKERKQVEEIIRNELFYYVPLQHNKQLLEPMWQLSQYIVKSEVIQIAYVRKDGVARTHMIKPVSIMFSEYYFYLIAYMADNSKDYPTVFRIDRLNSIKGTAEKFSIPYRDKFNEGEFRKRVQFMYSGELRRVKFEFSGSSLEAVLDRLPTAHVLSRQEGKYIIQAEVYGDGIDMWLRSQGEYIKLLEKI